MAVLFSRESVSVSMLDRQASRLVMLAGNCTVLSMASSPMVRCLVITPLEEGMTPSTRSLVKLERENMSPELSLLTSSRLL